MARALCRCATTALLVAVCTLSHSVLVDAFATYDVAVRHAQCELVQARWSIWGSERTNLSMLPSRIDDRCHARDSYEVLTHRSLIKEITLNHKRVVFSAKQSGHPRIPVWHIDHSLPPNTLLAVVSFHEHAATGVMRSSAGSIALRSRNASTDTTVLALQRESTHLWLVLDFEQLRRELPSIVPGPYAITLQLTNPALKEPFSLHLGDVVLVRVPAFEPFRLADIWDGHLLEKFLHRCANDPAFKSLLATRMLWGEVLVSLFSVTYCAAVTWFGPLNFTFWQLRAYQLSCAAGIAFQLVFIAWSASAIGVQLAFPLALALALVYFAAFNATNVLILLERDDAFPELEIQQQSMASEQRATLRVLLHVKRARWH